MNVKRVHDAMMQLMHEMNMTETDVRCLDGVMRRAWVHIEGRETCDALLLGSCQQIHVRLYNEWNEVK